MMPKVRASKGVVILVFTNLYPLLILTSGLVPHASGSSILLNIPELSQSDSINGTWLNSSPVVSPSPRYGHSMAFDSQLSKSILYGGVDWSSNQSTNDTWFYASGKNTWELANAKNAPRFRQFVPAMAYDSFARVSVLVSRGDCPLCLTETWLFNSSSASWINASPPHSPGPRNLHQISYSGDVAKVILFGGNSGGSAGRLGDTWVFDALLNNWSQRTPAGSPSPRYGHSMAYDPLRRRTVLFGGFDDSANGLKNDTWAYDAGNDTWNPISPTSAPAPRYEGNMVYDSTMKRMVLFGGRTQGSYFNDTWTYDLGNNSWNNVTPVQSPSGRWRSGMAFDPSAGSVLFGGNDKSALRNDTWIFRHQEQPPTAPLVVTSIPADGTQDVDLNQTIVVTFDQSMEASSTLGALRVVPPVAGSEAVVNGSVLTLSHSAPLQIGTMYRVQILDGARSSAGVRLQIPYSWEFTTAPQPRIVKAEPMDGSEGVAVDAPVKIYFDRDMDSQSLKQAFHIIPPVPLGNLSIGAGSLEWSHSEYFAPSTAYEVLLNGSATSRQGIPLASTFSFRFTTAPVGPPEGGNATSTLMRLILPVVGIASIIVLLSLVAAYAFGGANARYSILSFPAGILAAIKRERKLDHFVRGQVYGSIVMEPGINYSGIMRKFGLANGTLSYHLHILENEGFIKSEKDGPHRRFYPKDAPLSDRGILLSEVQKKIVEAVVKNDGISQSSIASQLRLPRQNVNYNVKRLVRVGLVRLEGWGPRRRCYLVEEKVTST